MLNLLILCLCFVITIFNFDLVFKSLENLIIPPHRLHFACRLLWNTRGAEGGGDDVAVAGDDRSAFSGGVGLSGDDRNLFNCDGDLVGDDT